MADSGSAGSRGPERRLGELEAIRIIDDFILRYRLPDGSTVVDTFLAGRRDLTEGDRQMLLGWRDPVEGIFEIRRKDGDAVAQLPERARRRRLPGLDLPFFELPQELAEADTVGVIYDEIDGMNFYADYAMLRDLFEDPSLGGAGSTRICCAHICAKSPSRHCRSADSSPPTPGQPTRSSANCCGSPDSPGPNTARICCADASPGTTSRSHAPECP